MQSQESQAAYRRHLVEHNAAVNRLLDQTTPKVRAFIRRRGYRLDLYPLEFVETLIADCEAFERDGAEPSDPPEA